MSEQWKAIPGYEGVYEVSDQGRVRRIGKAKGAQVGRIKKLTTKANGYVVVGMKNGSVRRVEYVHRLVMLAFAASESGRNEVNHIDGNPQNNRLENLEWASRSENQLHAIHVLKSCSPSALPGERNPQSKLTEAQVRQIRELYKTGQYSSRELADMFGVTKSPIKQIIRRKTWRHVS